MGKHPSPNLLCLLKTQSVLSAQPCPSREGLSPTSLPGEGFVWASLPVLEANLALTMVFANSWKPDPRPIPITVTPVSFYQLPAWVFVRCTSTGELQSSLSTPATTTLFLFGTQRVLATLRSVCFCESSFSKLCSQPLRASVYQPQRKKNTVNTIREASLETSGIPFFWCNRLFPHNLGFIYLFVLCQGCRLTTVSSGRTSALLGRGKSLS